MNGRCVFVSECVSKRLSDLFQHQAGMFGVSQFLQIIKLGSSEVKRFYFVYVLIHIDLQLSKGMKLHEQDFFWIRFYRLFRGRNSCRCFCVELVKLFPVHRYSVDIFFHIDALSISSQENRVCCFLIW